MEVNGRSVPINDHHNVTVHNVPAGKLDLKLHGADHGNVSLAVDNVAGGETVYVGVTGTVGTIHGVEHLSRKDQAWWAEKNAKGKPSPDVDWNNAPAYVHQEREHHEHKHHEHKHHHHKGEDKAGSNSNAN